MGTRGTYGFRINGKDKLAYNHWDSYQEGLGNTMLEFLRSMSGDDLRVAAKGLQLIDEDKPPTAAQIKQCKKAGTVNLGVSEGKETDWYCLLREAQGDLSALLKVGFMADSGKFIEDGLFCEWSYIINLDTNRLEVYKGGSKIRPVSRYTGTPDHHGYWGATLVDAIPLDQLPETFTEGYDVYDEKLGEGVVSPVCGVPEGYVG